MPVYEYFCEVCQKDFEAVMSLKEHEEGKVTCPKCGTDKVHQIAAFFTAVTSKKS